MERKPQPSFDRFSEKPARGRFSSGDRFADRGERRPRFGGDDRFADRGSRFDSDRGERRFDRNDRFGGERREGGFGGNRFGGERRPQRTALCGSLRSPREGCGNPSLCRSSGVRADADRAS